MNEKRKRDEKKRDVYHDTDFLLKKYRNARRSLQESQDDHQSLFEEEFGMNISEYLEQLHVAGMEMDMKGPLEAHARTMDRTNKILKRIDRAVEVVRDSEADGELLYTILYHAFLSDRAYADVKDVLAGINETAGEFFRMEKSTQYYRLRKKAIRSVGEILWGYTTRDALDITDSMFEENFV